MQEQATSSAAASSLPSSSERSSSSALHLEVKEGMESDEEIRRVPEIGGESAGTSASGRDTGSVAGPDRVQVSREGQRKRGRSPADKESKRLKRLLRNRVSAQQARERKKAYLNDLEIRVKDVEKKNSELEERLSTLQNENQMLRQMLALPQPMVPHIFLRSVEEATLARSRPETSSCRSTKGCGTMVLPAVDDIKYDALAAKIARASLTLSRFRSSTCARSRRAPPPFSCPKRPSTPSLTNPMF